MDYSRKYIIINYNEVDKINFDEILITSKETLTLSVDGTKTYIKWDGDNPSFIVDFDVKSSIYNNSQILEILSTSEWTNPITHTPTPIFN